jgi:serine/threonine protein kinase
MPSNEAKLVAGIYRIGQILSNSSMLSTCTAYDRNTNDVVGLVILGLPAGDHAQFIQPYLQLLEKRRNIQSPHVLHVHSWGIETSRMYIVTDPPRGMTLQHVMDNENIDLRRSLDLVKQLGQGVIALHEQRIGGLDLRPQLITVDALGINDRVQIDDLGLRVLLRQLWPINGQNVNDIAYLDPRYASPEHINNQPLGPWSDVYLLGLLLFTLVTGRTPFVGQNAAETGVMQSTTPIPQMLQFAHDTPEKLQNIIEVAMAKESERRFKNVHAFMNALESIQLPAPRRMPELSTAHEPKTGPQQSIGLTTEMTMIEDLSLVSTKIESNNLPSASGEHPAIQVSPADKFVYAYLRVEKDGRVLQRFPLLQKKTIIGRRDPKHQHMPDLDLTDFDPKMTVSRQHARISFEETFFYIEDLKSRNKTRLGELTLTPHKAELMQHGDTVTFGTVRLRFEVPGMLPLKEKKNKDEEQPSAPLSPPTKDGTTRQVLPDEPIA